MAKGANLRLTQLWGLGRGVAMGESPLASRVETALNSAMTGTLSHAEARATYDRIGSLQDTQRFYEDAAVRELLEHADFEHASAVLEFGCGTGRHAEHLLSERLPGDATYLALDQSTTMIELARNRVRRFSDRAEVRQTDGSTRIDAPNRSADRFFSTYVLDLLSHEDISQVLAEAHRILRDDGRLCLVGLTRGETLPQRLVAATAERIFKWRPQFVGGCRPVELTKFLSGDRWRVLHRGVVSRFALPSEVVVATPVRATKEAAQ